MNPENLLSCLLEIRDYQSLEMLVEFYIRKYGWSYIIDLINKAKSLDRIAPDTEVQLREGVLRNGLFSLLGLNQFCGADIDPLTIIADLQDDSLPEIRRHARKKMVELVKEQIRRGVTFFLNIEEMEAADLKVLIPYILDARIDEIQALESNPPLSDVYSTYYGFNILTYGGIVIKESGVPEELREKLTSVLSDIGNVESLPAKQLRFSPLAFRGCSDYLNKLLWNMLKVSIGGSKGRSIALKRLGALGDQRAFPVIEPALMTYREKTLSDIDRYFLELFECAALLSNGKFFIAIQNTLRNIKFEKLELHKRYSDHYAHLAYLTLSNFPRF